MNIKNWKINSSNKAKRNEYKPLNKAHDFKSISINNGYVISMEQVDKHARCLIVMPNQEIAYLESEKQFFSQSELDELFEKISEFGLENNIQTEEEILDNVRNIVLLSSLNRKYIDNNKNQIITVPMGAIEFINIANEYFEQATNDEEEMQPTLTFINTGDLDLINEFNVNEFLNNKNSEIILVQSEENEINKLAKSKEGIIKNPYNINNQFFRYMKDIKSDNFFDSSLLAYTMYKPLIELNADFFTMQNFKDIANSLIRNKEVVNQDDILKQIFSFVTLAVDKYKTFSENDLKYHYNPIKNKITSIIEDKEKRLKLQLYLNKFGPEEIDQDEIDFMLNQGKYSYRDGIKSSQKDQRTNKNRIER